MVVISISTYLRAQFIQGNSLVAALAEESDRQPGADLPLGVDFPVDVDMILDVVLNENMQEVKKPLPTPGPWDEKLIKTMKASIEKKRKATAKKPASKRCVY